MYARPARKNPRKALSATAADIAEDTAVTEDAEKDTAVVKGTAAERDTAVRDTAVRDTAVRDTAVRVTAAESARRRTITS